MKKVDIQRFKPQAVFLQIGNLRSIPVEGIVGIFDMDTATRSPVTAQYLREAEKRGGITSVSTALPKSFIIYDDGVLEQIYFSPFSAAILRQRMEIGAVIQVQM